ncbi:MAG: peptidoglycan-binding protein [Leptolyngbya sp.]|nr:peptidoglycan-binding protein [Leptolyngbya sp.]
MAGVPAVGIDLIKAFEGCSLTAYPDPLSGGEPYTIGWGSTRYKDGAAVRLGDRLTQAEADDLLLWKVERSFLPPLARIPGWDLFNDAQAGAILSFAYNLGAGFYGSSGFETLSRVLRTAQWQELEYALSLYRNPGTNVEEGLLRRRLSEAQAFLAATPGMGLSQAGLDYLNNRGRTYRQNKLLSDQAIAYLAFIRNNRQPNPGKITPTAPSGDTTPTTPAPTSPTPPPAPSPEPPATAGDRLLYLTEPYLQGPDVREIQTALARTGAGVVTDGVFGPATKLAVERYQQVNGLPVDGVVGPVTRSRLLQRVLYLATPPMTGDDVKTLQQQLRTQGISVTLDGVFGPSTDTAVKTFQRYAGVLVDGIVGPRTRSLLSARPLKLTYPNLQGADVTALQKALTRAGLAVTIDGVFGPSTDWAVKQFQTRHYLLADGIVGPRTYAKLGL